MTTTKQRKPVRHMAESRPDEIEARMLRVIGMSLPDIFAVTGIDVLGLSGLGFGEIIVPGPYDADQVARMIGFDYRTVYHLLASGELKSTIRKTKVTNGKGTVSKSIYSVTRKQLQQFCRRRLDRDGERRAKYLLFAGVASSTAALRGGLDAAGIAKNLRELNMAGIGPNDAGPFSILQASVVLDIKPRITRRYCEEGRLGKVLPDTLAAEYGITTKYVITRQDILEFGSKPRQVGRPGQVNRQRELAQRSKHHSNGHANGRK